MTLERSEPCTKRSYEDISDDLKDVKKRIRKDSPDFFSSVSNSSVSKEPKNPSTMSKVIPMCFKDVETYVSKFQFSAKLISKGPIRKQFYTSGNIFQLELMDLTGKITGKVYNTNCDKLHKQLEVGATYSFEKVSLTASSPNEDIFKYDLIIDSNTIIREIQND
ncbi:hypothetical protein QAD02_017293 [Eretmocerus hayati]|uniref:Uncharacterized protein n=1 Tax=Eretmocerus hayati TaxID=131215 RepID=A0ACC2PDE9_9HYME|nr:hypothetical protein QAD02_017293 [Eretmocerus hayati]